MLERLVGGETAVNDSLALLQDGRTVQARQFKHLYLIFIIIVSDSVLSNAKELSSYTL